MKRLLLTLLLLLALARPAFADKGALSLLLDAESLAYLHEVGAPLFEAAGLAEGRVRIHIVAGNEVNAFVASNRDMYFFTGLIARASSATEVVGVMAHETGHIQGRHLFRAAQHGENLTLPTILGSVVGIGAMVAGAGQAGQAIFVGSQAAGLSSNLRFSRSQEQQADQIGVTLLQDTGYPISGLVSFFEKLKKEESLYSKTPPAYLLTHPLTTGRMEFVKLEGQKRQPNGGARHPDDARFRRVQAKLFALSNPPARTLRKYMRDTSVEARYAKAIAQALLAKRKEADDMVNQLLAESPDDAFFHELKAQIAQDHGDMALARTHFQKAVERAPLPLLRLQLAEVKVEQGDIDDALRDLLPVRDKMPDWPRVHQRLGMAYGKLGKLGLSHLSLAEASFLVGNKADTTYHLKVADENLAATDAEAKKRLKELQEDVERRDEDTWQNP